MLNGLYLQFSEQINKQTNASMHTLVKRLLANPPQGLYDVIPGYTNVYLEFDDAFITVERLRAYVQALWPEDAVAAGRLRRIRVRYDGADLDEVSERTGLSVAELVRVHSEQTYYVYALGFMPGFAFMGELPGVLRLPRRATPRARVSAHSVAIAGVQTGVYPLASPGGWHVLGHALDALYDPHREDAFLLRAGDSVQFVAEQDATKHIPAEPSPLVLLPETPETPVLRVLKAGLQDLVMDAGRTLQGCYGLARSGYLDARSAALANRLLAQDAGVPLLEMTLTGPTFEVLADTVIAVTGYALTPLINHEPQDTFCTLALKQGDVLSFKPKTEGARSYLAIAGGLESRQFRGSASVDLRAKIGRALRAGDVLGRAFTPTKRAGFKFIPYKPVFKKTIMLRLLPGPQVHSEAMHVLTRNTFTVASADRTGIRFEGAPVPGGEVLSEGTPLGALQVPASGMPILLLNDKGSMGGYTKPARVHPNDLPIAAQLRPGQQVRFIPVP